MTSRQRDSVTTSITLSYFVFLLICMILVLFLCLSISHAARETFWDEQATKLEIGVSVMDGYETAMRSYTQQLLTAPSFARLINLDRSDMTALMLAADRTMQEMTSREFGLMQLPITSHDLYLERSGYAISASHFSEMEPYYRAFRSFDTSCYEDWLSMLAAAPMDGAFVPASRFTQTADSWFYIIRIRPIGVSPVPAVHWFELDVPAIRRMFLPASAADAGFFLLDREGAWEMSLGQADALPQLAYDEDGMADQGGMRYIRRTGATGRAYVLALPHSMCDAALGRQQLLVVGVFLLALLLGLALVFALTRRALKPYRQLNHQLSQAQDDNAALIRQISEHEPAVKASHLRKLLSGHVTSPEEFAYIMRDLSLDGNLQYYALYCTAYPQEADEGIDRQLVLSLIEKHLTGNHPLHSYSTLDESIVVLTAYDADAPDPLGDMEARVLALHGELLEHYGVWFYAGIGECCAEPQRLWESYEQARMAVRYATRDRILIPYSKIGKSGDTWYYPMELTAKLLHFITSGNRQQVSEMFALIHRENVQERSLSMEMLTLLLSDLRNTLIKARFLIPPARQADAQDALARLDERLREPASFPALEAAGRALCDFFVSAAEPSNPVPEIMQYLQDNFSDPSLSLNKLSSHFNISESYLSHLFKDRTGQNVSAYLENLRISEAARRLQDPGCNLSTLYLDVGYTNPTTLRRAFKRRFGMTPSEMRGRAS